MIIFCIYNKIYEQDADSARDLLLSGASGKVWSDDEREAFIDWIAANPEAGDLIPQTGGLCKVRWGMAGSDKKGSARVITFTKNAEGMVVLLTVYSKSVTDNILAKALNKMAKLLNVKG